MGSYLPLFSITGEHTFFSSKLCSGMLIEPSCSSVLMMKNVGLLLRNLSGGVRIFFDQGKKQALKSYIEENEGRLSFEFKVKSKDPYFLNYTDLLDGTHGEVLYLENKKCEDNRFGRVPLHKEEYINDNFYIPIASPLLEGVLDNGEYAVPPLICIRVNLESCLNEDFYHMSNYREKQFYFRFRERKTYWKYYVLGCRSSNRMHITDLNGQVEFQEFGEKMLPHNKRAKVFRSTTPISLIDRPVHYFQLHEKTLGTGRVFVKRLPGPLLEQIAREEVQGTTVVVSEIYVNC